MAFTKITAAGIGSTETVTLDGLSVINNGSFGGNLTVGGVLTYEDVTNVDSVGLITARNGIVVGSGITLSKDGDIFATGVTTTGSLVSNGAISGTTGTFTSLFSPTLIGNQTTSLFRTNTSDGSDNKSVMIAGGGGGSDARGAYVHARGNEHASAGRLDLVAGNVGTAPIVMETADTERLRITSTGLVGIGTHTPSELVDALKSGNDAIIKTRTAGAGAYFEADSAATEGYYGLKLSTNGTERWFVGSYNKNDFQIKDGSGASGTTMLTIADSTGNTGLGTDNPTSRLHLAGRLSVHHSAVDTEGEFLRIGRTDLPLIRYHSIKAKHGGATANNYITFNLHNTSDTTSQLEVLRLRGDGMVGIDLINPDVKLSVKGASVGGTANDQNDTLKLINYTANTSQLIFGTKRLSNGSDWQTTCERIQRRIDVTKMGYIDFGRVNDGYKMVIGNESQGDVLECKADGDVVVTNGDVVFAAGHGINFSQNANHAQANNELLDDYEEGTFTPSFKAGNNSNNASTTVNEAQYTKIGNVVYFRLYIQLAGHATGTTGGDAFIVDLPFTNIAGHAAVSVSYFANWAANQMFVGATVQPSAAHILFRHNISVSSATANMDYDNNLQVGSAVIVSGCYITTAS